MHVQSYWEVSRSFLLGLAVVALLLPGCQTQPEPAPAPKEDETPSSVREMLAERAEELLAKAQATPEDPAAWYRLGNAYLDLTDFGRAVAAYNRALAGDPQLVAAHCNRGLALRALGDFPAAVAAYQRALSIAPDDAVVLENLAALQERMGDYAGAADSVARLFALSPDRVELRSALAGLLLKAGRYEEAQETAAAIVGSGRAEADDYFTLGAARLGLGDAAGALDAWAQALAMEPGHAATLRAAVELYVSQGQYEEAWNVVRRCERYGVQLDHAFIRRLQEASGHLGPG